jgi:excisionase family DNA binding protein
VLDRKLTLKVEEAAALLGISRAHAYEMVRRGKLPSVRLGRRIVIPDRALRELLDAGGSSLLTEEHASTP